MVVLLARPLPMAVMLVHVMSCRPTWFLASAADAAAGKDSAAARPRTARILHRRMLGSFLGGGWPGIGQWADIVAEVARMARSSTSRLLPRERVGARISTARVAPCRWVSWETSRRCHLPAPATAPTVSTA